MRSRVLEGRGLPVRRCVHGLREAALGPAGWGRTMSPETALALEMLKLAVGVVGPALAHEKIDEWAAVEAAAEAAKLAKFGPRTESEP